ncbi:hypothetical protein PUW25_25355 (plasmid) [Paenibacillus urinalis]|uniref:Uncharacterized protein n=1 Tax=Paenibacillus urinalis TaxID=521520 RepID=A0ABY7XH97_9BACL|nr:hypothetical protein [Paenibacillus urinalis]WDI05138.1 hypothetical protein PUW25_25355 [Paenibacillus urinalis]
MFRDETNLNAKGRVKLEMYNDHEGVFFTKEKKNIAVHSLNNIIAQMMADPAGKTRAKQTDKGETALAPNAKGVYEFDLSIACESEGTYTTDVGSANTSTDLVIPDITRLLSVISVEADGQALVLNKDVSIKDPDAATLKFAVAPKNTVTVKFRKVASEYAEVVAGSETITVGGEAYTLADVPSEENKQYGIDYKLGKVYFAAAKTNVKADYQFKLFYSLGFMGLGGKPEGHPENKPVEFAESDKLRIKMDGEYAGARQLIQYPSLISMGDPEVEVFPTKPITFSEKVITVTGDGAATSFPLNPENKVLKILSAKLETDATDVTVTLEGSNVVFAEAPAEGVKVIVRFQDQLDNSHLTFEMADAPIMELVSVKHQALDNTVKEYKIVDKGLSIGKGDVWIVNSGKGIIQFSLAPQGVDALDPSKKPPVVETPGLLTFEYRVNSGTTVQFVADFPKGVPGPMNVEKTETLNVSSAVTTYTLNKAATKDSEGKFILAVTLNGVAQVEGTGYDVSADGKQITFKVSLQDTDSVNVVYQYSETTHVIYQVGMFAEQEEGKMSNISGIGPVTKDASTGMRVTWSMTI